MKQHPLEPALDRLVKATDAQAFGAPVEVVYNPLNYAGGIFRRYLRQWGNRPKSALWLGMNPGPWGMAQTGIPFGEVAAVRDWLGLSGPVGKPPLEHPKRPIEGFDCARSEVSGRRLWGFLAAEFSHADAFFKQHIILNYCPLVFMSSSGANLTPDKLAAAEREPLFAACDLFLQEALDYFQAKYLIGVGGFAAQCFQRVAGDNPDHQIVQILHPSPASPAANRDWAGAVRKQLAPFPQLLINQA